ncbi:unnamed protein product [Caenorhabditis auriculariae]|uniref:Uncharacterized protein n=1 Tax=Caenorhabditis auriculariae TaxID=2777116 RepID=A0A8S1H3L7_9PELO|nr:unnamed protein product [Caenorhabditis auriculariae]
MDCICALLLRARTLQLASPFTTASSLHLLIFLFCEEAEQIEDSFPHDIADTCGPGGKCCVSASSTYD